MEVLPTPDQDQGWRLARIEDRLEALSERLGRLETLLRDAAAGEVLRDAVAGEVHGATAELRRAISELGRRLVQDLPAELARHRDAIVAELRPPPAPVPATAPTDDREPPPELAAELAEVDEVDDVDDVAERPEGAERRRTLAGRRRRRQD